MPEHRSVGGRPDGAHRRRESTAPVDGARVLACSEGADPAAAPASPFRAQTDAKYVKAVTRQGELVAVGEIVVPNLYHPMVVL